MYVNLRLQHQRKGPSKINHNDGTGTNRNWRMTFSNKERNLALTFLSIKYPWYNLFINEL